MIDWDAVAGEFSYSSARAMFEKLHQIFSVSQLAVRFGVPAPTIREALEAFGIRGNVRRIQLGTLTPGEAREIQKEGFKKAAKRLRISAVALEREVTELLREIARRIECSNRDEQTKN